MSGLVKRAAQRPLIASPSASSVTAARLAQARPSPWKNDRSAASAATAQSFYPEYDDQHHSTLHESSSRQASLSAEQRQFLDRAVSLVSNALPLIL
jgi:hypothetical protein